MSYNPPTRTAVLSMPYLAMVNRADPDWAYLRKREVEYEFSNRRFVANPDKAGSYNTNPNIYPVGTNEPR